MNEIEHLLTVLSEEGAEIIQDACKAIRFGIHDFKPGDTDDNWRKLEREVAQLLAVAEILGLEIREEDKAAKREKLKKYMDYSRQIGTLEGPVEPNCEHAWTPINLSSGFDSQCRKCGVKADLGT